MVRRIDLWGNRHCKTTPDDLELFRGHLWPKTCRKPAREFQARLPSSTQPGARGVGKTFKNVEGFALSRAAGARPDLKKAPPKIRPDCLEVPSPIGIGIWVLEGSLAGHLRVGVRPNFGQTLPQNLSRKTGLVLQCRLHQKSDRQTNYDAILWRHKNQARLPSGTQFVRYLATIEKSNIANH